MNCRGCWLIDRFALNINGRIDTEDARLTLCCENLPSIPGVPFTGTAEESLRAFAGEYLLTAVECARVPERGPRFFTSDCAKCLHFVEGEHRITPLIGYVNLSMYPAPCQSHCIYCEAYTKAPAIRTEAAKAAYEKVFDMLELARNSGILAPNAVWQVSSGEIAIHPYHDRILNLVKGETATFYTNCMKFDEMVAQNLHDNPGSAINLSIDAGTPETWKKVKGVDNFDSVLENLVRYRAKSARPGQITLKYIVLPDINDFYEDYLSLMEIMKGLEVRHLALSRDGRKTYNLSREEQTKLTGAAAYLVAMCHKNGFTNNLGSYSQNEQAEIIRQADEILRKGLI